MPLFNFFRSPKSQVDWYANDKQFNRLYPPHIASLSRPHWTPMAVARSASQFLAVPGKKILDIGSGVGKFCLIAGAFHKDTEFYGVEQRLNLVHFAKEAQETLQLQNVHFIHGNVTETDFNAYDHYYFYNAFYEHLDHVDKIDADIRFSEEQFDRYTSHLFKQLATSRAGTRLVTYHAHREQVPDTYQLVKREFDMRLECWIKE